MIEASQPRNNVVIIRIKNPEIVKKAHNVQEEVLKRSHDFKSHLQPLRSLHLTLFVTTNVPDGKLKDAKDALKCSAKQMNRLLKGKKFKLTLKGIHEFKKGVLYFAVRRDHNGIQKLYEIVEKEFRKRGLPSKPGKRFHPHVTLVSVSGKAEYLRKKWKIHHGVKIGTQDVESLELCENCSVGLDPHTHDYRVTYKAHL
ncbi:hypothetical protein M3Y95_01154500 [Aphelenchoides besseyi]|nr:hypothetical protein M3Y95_01154500 [Aphelenchoides besseyi]